MLKMFWKLKQEKGKERKKEGLKFLFHNSEIQNERKFVAKPDPNCPETISSLYLFHLVLIYY
jgi:hypothetical protein